MAGTGENGDYDLAGRRWRENKRLPDRKGLIDKVYCSIAPKIVGGREAPTPVGGRGIPQLKNALPLKSMEIQRFDEDILIIAEVGGRKSEVRGVTD